MKVIWIGLAKGLGGWLATAALLSWLMQAYGAMHAGATLGFSLLFGLLVWAAIGLLAGAFGRLRERAALRAAAAGAAPRDGRHQVLVGRLAPVGMLLDGAPGGRLNAPLDGAPCLMYSYRVGWHVGSGKRRSVGTAVRGVALAPCRVVTAAGSHKLLAVPEITGLTPTNGRSDQVARFRDYVHHTPLTPAKASAAELLRQWADDDGSYRSDVELASLADTDAGLWTFVQHCVPAGAQVCVFGTYSKARGGIVPTAAAPVRVVVGSPAEMAEALRRQATTWSVIALGLLAATALVVWLNRPDAL